MTDVFPAPLRPANVMFASVYPYDGFGRIIAAAQAVADIAYLIGAATVDASKLLPELVVSTRATVEPAD